MINQQAMKKITFVNWSIGVILALGGIGMLNEQPLPGILGIAASLFLLPPVRTFAYHKSKIALPSSVRAVSVVLLIGFAGYLSPQEEPQVAHQIKEKPIDIKLSPKQAKMVAKANKKEARDKKLREQFSLWDGSHKKLVEYTKRHMNDPKSFEHVETKWADKGKRLLVSMEFRGKNAFGGTIRNKVIAMVDSKDGTVLEVVEDS